MEGIVDRFISQKTDGLWLCDSTSLDNAATNCIMNLKLTSSDEGLARFQLYSRKIVI